MKAREKGVDGRPAEGAPADRENAGAKFSQETLAVVIEDSVATPFEVAAAAVPADIRSVQVTGDVGSQCSTGDRVVRQ